MKQLLIFIFSVAIFTGCSDEPAKLQQHEPAVQTTSNPNAVAVNALTRTNLGISFAKVERRPVRKTFRLPGEFELRPDAWRDYTPTFSGKVNLRVKQYDKVKKGQVLFTVDSPEWRDLQHQLNESLSNTKIVEDKINIAEKSLDEAKATKKLLKQRIDQLKKANVKNAELETELLKTTKRIEVLKAQLNLTKKEFETAKQHYKHSLHNADVLTGVSCPELLKEIEGVPYWSILSLVEFKATEDAVVQTLGVTNGGWAEVGTTVIRTVKPNALRFRAEALQSDLLKFKNGMSARIVAPQGSSIEINEFMQGDITLGFEGNSLQRTIPIFVTPDLMEDWANAGVAAYLEVFVSGSERAELAIPKKSIIRDGLKDIFFRRNPKNPNEVIKIEADLGVDDGRWVVVKSGVRAGDEVVLEGVYELKLATASDTGKPQEKGHFHADGKWCDGNH